MKPFATIVRLLLALCISLTGAAKPEPTQLQIGIKHKGDCSKKAKTGQTIKAHYTGRLFSDGTVFDSSVENGRDAFQFKLGVGHVIKGIVCVLLKLTVF